MTPGYFTASGGIGSAWGAPVPAHVPDAGRGAPPGQDVERWARMTAERVRNWVAGGMLAFPPWLDNYTEETEAHRRAYRQMFAEPVVHAATMANVYSVAELEVQTHPQDPEDPREQEAAEFVGHALRTARGGVVGLVTALLTGALIDGWSLVEPVWEPVTEGKYRGKWAWRAVKAKDVRHLTPLVDGFLNVIGIRSQAGLLGLRVFDPADFLVYRNLSLFESPRGLSDYRAAYRAWWIMATAWRLRALGLERWSQPSLKGTYTDEGQHRQALEAALAGYQANTWLTVPLGCTVDAIDIANRGESDFKSAIADLREEMAITCSYATLTILTSAQTNPRGDSEVQKTTTQLKQWGLAANVGAVLTEQAAPPLTRLNYPGVPPCTVTLGAVDEGALSARLRNDTGLVKDLGLKLSRKESYRYYGRQQPAGPDDELGGPPAPKPPPGGNGTGNGAAGGPPAVPFAEAFAEERGGDPDTADVDEQAELIAEILYGVFGAGAAGSYDHAEGAEAFAAGWDALHHPRGPDGRFIPKGSAEAVGAAKEKIGALKGKPATDANVAALASHLHILTVPQLRALHKEHGLTIPGRLRAQLVEGVKAQLLAAAGKAPKKGPKEAPAPSAPAGGVVTDDTPLRAGLNPPGWPVSTSLKDLRDFARQKLGKRFHSVVVRKYGGGSQVEVLGVKEGYHGRQTFLAATYPHIGQPGPKPPAVSTPAQKLPREDEARAQYDRERQLEGSPRRFDAVVAELRKAGGTDKDVQDVIDLYAPERKALAGPPHADPTRLPTDAELAAGKAEKLGEVSLHSHSMRRIHTPAGTFYHKPLPSPGAAEREVAVADLARIAGADAPAARVADLGDPNQPGGARGVLTAEVPGVPLAEALKDDPRARDKLDPAGVTRHLLFSYVAGVGDRHAGNYIVGPPGPGGRRPVTSIDHEFSLGTGRPTEAFHRAFASDLITHKPGVPVKLDPGAVKEMAATIPAMMEHLKAAGMDKEASALALRGEALARLASDPAPTDRKLSDHAWAVGVGSDEPDPNSARKVAAVRAAPPRRKDELVVELSFRQAEQLLRELDRGPDDPHARAAVYEFFPELKPRK
jgi:hypothetical protein